MPTQPLCRPSIQNYYESKKSTTTAATPNGRQKECQQSAECEGQVRTERVGVARIRQRYAVISIVGRKFSSDFFFSSFLKNFLSIIYYFLNVVSLKIHYSCFYHIHFISTVLRLETFIATLYTYYMYIFFMVVLYREGKQFFQIVRNHVLHYENERILT